jgi:hypothetical protein
MGVGARDADRVWIAIGSMHCAQVSDRILPPIDYTMGNDSLHWRCFCPLQTSSEPVP